MSVLDTWALVAVLLGEPGWQEIQARLEAVQPWRISAVTLAEASMVVEARLGAAGKVQLDSLLLRIGADVRPVDAATVHVALDGWRRYGRGRHPARLNFGACFSYALATELGAPLLFVGDDFGQTDVVSALA